MQEAADICGVLYQAAVEHTGQNLVLETPYGPVLMVQNPGDLRDVLKRPNDFKKYVGAVRGVFGESRLTSDDPAWRTLRDVSQGQIAQVSRQSVLRATARHYATAAEQIATSSKRDGFADLQAEIDLAAARTAAEVIFDIPGDLITPAITSAIQTMLVSLSSLNWLAADGSESKAVSDQLDDVKHMLKGILQNRLSAGPDNQVLENLQGLNDPMDEFATVLISAYDTTSTLILWTLYLLSRSPSEQDHVQRDLDHEIVLNELRDGSFETGLPIASAMREALRIFPPVPFVGRVAAQETAIGSAKVPKGQKILLSLLGGNLGDANRAQPLSFDPRGLVNGIAQRTAGSGSLTFGGGRRVCPGSDIALTETGAALSLLLSRFTFRSDDTPLGKLALGISMRRTQGFPLSAEGRNGFG